MHSQHVRLLERVCDDEQGIWSGDYSGRQPDDADTFGDALQFRWIAGDVAREPHGASGYIPLVDVE